MILCCGKTELARGYSDEIMPGKIDSFLALSNYNAFWMAPNTGNRWEDIPPDTLYLLWKAGKTYGVALPLVDGDIKCTVSGCAQGIVVHTEGALESPEQARVLCMAYDTDPYRLTEYAVREVQERLGTFRLRREKDKPSYLNVLGWCTWNAFFHDGLATLSTQGILEGLEQFRQNGIKIPMLLLDDGALVQKDGYMMEPRLSDSVLPGGLKYLVDRVKQRYQVQYFGAWHALPGYWKGVHPDKQRHRRLISSVPLYCTFLVLRGDSGNKSINDILSAEVKNMEKFKLLVRSQLFMGRPATDDDRKALNCYYETPVFFCNSNCETVEIIDAAYELFCAGKPEFRCTESVELVRIA